MYIADVLSGVCLARELPGLWQTKTYYAYATEGHARQTNKKKAAAKTRTRWMWTGWESGAKGLILVQIRRIYRWEKYIEYKISNELNEKFLSELKDTELRL